MQYQIKKNKHRINRLYFNPYFGENFIIKGSFSKECWYSENEVDEYGDKNKLFGMSLEVFPKKVKLPGGKVSYAPWHWNSVRLAWRPDFNRQNVINVYTYIYDIGERINTNKPLFSIKTEDEFMVGFESSNLSLSTEYKIHAYANNKKYLDEHCFEYLVNPTGYYLPPYFGGDNVTPRDMSFNIQLDKE